LIVPGGDMTKVYQLVRGVVEANLHRRKPRTIVSARVKDSEGSLNDAIEELEKIFVDRIGSLKGSVSDDQAVVASEAQHAEQVIAGLKANITVLEAKLRETEDTVHRKDVASQKMEESLSTEIRDLQSVVRKKEEALKSRDSEVKDRNSKIDVLTEQVTHLGLAIQQAKGEAASEAQHAEQFIEGLKIEIATLQDQLRQTEQIVGGTDSTINGLDPNHNRHAIHLSAQLEAQTNGMKDSKAEALLGIQAQAIDPVFAGEKLKPGEEKPTDFHFQAAGVTSILTEAARDTVSQEAFERMIADFSELANVIESIASLIVRDHVRVLGESIEQFPQARLTELLEALSKEISDDKLKTDFCQRFGKV
jgi:hypothetical protein